MNFNKSRDTYRVSDAHVEAVLKVSTVTLTIKTNESQLCEQKCCQVSVRNRMKYKIICRDCIQWLSAWFSFRKVSIALISTGIFLLVDQF